MLMSQTCSTLRGDVRGRGDRGQPAIPNTPFVFAGWPFDNAMCKMSGLVQGMSVSASVFTLVAIAVERYVGMGGS